MNDFATDVQTLEHYLHNLTTMDGIQHPAQVRAAINRLYAEAFVLGGGYDKEVAEED